GNHDSELPPPEPDALESMLDDSTPAPVQTAAALQGFHYHLPAELETTVQAGHLVWVPFGHQQVQGIVVRLCAAAPVQTKAVLRLARAEPVVTVAQLALAVWLADTYVAPLAETVKLLLPPGLLAKTDGANSVRVKREIQIALAIDPATIDQQLLNLGRSTPKAAVLACLVANPGATPTDAQLQRMCNLPTPASIKALVTDGVLQRVADGVRLAHPVEQMRQLLLHLRGVEKQAAVLRALAEIKTPLWKSDLYTRVKADLDTLRSLQSAGMITLTEGVRFRDPLAGQIHAQTTAPPLTSEQTRVWQTVATAWNSSQEDNPQFLLHGVTGSGKTEIYLRAIERVLAAERQAIVLVPEIALTPQTVARFAGRFPGRVTVIHSGLSKGERYDIWRAVRNGDFDVIIGPRSALFAPLPRLGLIILDEEHESSYKQNAEEWGSYTVFYDARRVAQQLAHLTGSVLILGSATPSLESYYAAKQGSLILLEMPHRVMGHAAPAANGEGSATLPAVAIYAEMPPVEIVDMRQELRAGHRSIFSRSLQAELHATLDAGEQAILFLNRRGTHTFVMCRDCGDVQECRRCEVPLIYHENAAELICHHCSRRYPIPTICPQCDSKRIKYFGSGTQRIEELISQIAPRARLLRWDADTTGRKGSHAALLRRFANHEADVLVGTQMIAKGLDLPLVTLVGVVAADVGLFLPDFRSSERTFQLLTQVAGRAGRSARGGRVVIQSYRPEHYAIQAAAQHDYAAFYGREIAFRHEHRYPPVRRLARLIYWDKKLNKAKEAAETMAATLRYCLESMGLAGTAANVMGPAPAFFARHRGYYRWQILLNAPNPAAVLQGIAIPYGWRVDIDPVSML
ncbi:MAG: primosomal protein N', partial [Chloroflexota bacterium]|nr:primosomal protein N' [Chloroflexota bacterium]